MLSPKDRAGRFAEFVGARHCIGVNSGTSALHLALIAAGIGPGDEVITTPLTWISTSWAISYVGARPVFVDVDEATRTIDPELVERAITPAELGIPPQSLLEHGTVVLAVVRGGEVHRFDEGVVTLLQKGDRIVVIRASGSDSHTTHGTAY